MNVLLTLVLTLAAIVLLGNKVTTKWIDPVLMEFDADLGQRLNAVYWQRQSVKTLKERIAHLGKIGVNHASKKRAKNIILFLGDGYGVASVTATRKLKEQFSGEPFYKNKLVCDSFPFSGYSKTYGLDTVIAESAGTATAYLCGIKTRQGFIGLDGSADLNCTNSGKSHVESIAARAARAGKSSGFVTTTAITNASPSGVYANTPLRQFEYPSEEHNFSTTHPNCEDIAKQFVKKAHFLKVAMGGGRGQFMPNSVVPEGETTKKGLRNDGRNLIEEWKTDRWQRGVTKSTYVTKRDDLLALEPEKVDYLLGLFNYGHMTYMDNNPPASEPTLTEMTTMAIKVLSQNKNGFFLFVEGGRIDHGHHRGIARLALTEAIEFDKAVKAAVEMTDPSETLIVVTADHSHSLSLSGVLRHKDSILGTSVEMADDDKFYTSLAYANGPGAYIKSQDGSRRNDTAADTTAHGYHQQAIVPIPMEMHGGEDVPVYANGIHSELFSGVFEQSYIPWAMACAAGIHYGASPGTIVSELKELCPLEPTRSEAAAAATQAVVVSQSDCRPRRGLASGMPSVSGFIVSICLVLSFV